MKTKLIISSTLLLLISMVFGFQSSEDKESNNSGLTEHLRPLGQFIGKSWLCKSPTPDPENPF